MRFPMTMFVLSMVTVVLTTCIPARSQPDSMYDLSPFVVQTIATTTTLPPIEAMSYRADMEAGVTTTTTTVPAGDWACPEWIGLVLEAGFPKSVLPKVDFIIHRESTCRPTSFNRKDPNGGSRGLMQINGIWCQHWLQDQGILSTCDDLFDPLTNLKAALAIYQRHGDFSAWRL